MAADRVEQRRNANFLGWRVPRYANGCQIMNDLTYGTLIAYAKADVAEALRRTPSTTIASPGMVAGLVDLTRALASHAQQLHAYGPFHSAGADRLTTALAHWKDNQFALLTAPRRRRSRWRSRAHRSSTYASPPEAFALPPNLSPA